MGAVKSKHQRRRKCGTITNRHTCIDPAVFCQPDCTVQPAHSCVCHTDVQPVVPCCHCCCQLYRKARDCHHPSNLWTFDDDHVAQETKAEAVKVERNNVLLGEEEHLDTHPIIVQLQNEQNSRRESMEKRFMKIREKAKLEADKRQQVQLEVTGSKRAKSLLDEANAALQMFRNGRRLCRKSANKCTSPRVSVDTVDMDDIAPTTVISNRQRALSCVRGISRADQTLTWLLQPVRPFQLSKLVCLLISRHSRLCRYCHIFKYHQCIVR